MVVEALTQKNAVYVCGHPRSGTSTACQVVESAGVKFPSDFEGDEYNKAGYYELELAKQLESRLMKEAMTDSNTADLNTITQKLNAIEGVAGLKVVRIAAVFFYRHISKNPRAVFIFRHPADVKASMYRRGISEFWPGWVENNNALIAAHENFQNSIVISYESLIEKRSHIKRGFEKIGLNVDLNVVRAAEQTQKNSRVYCTEDELNLYKLLQKLEKQSCG